MLTQSGAAGSVQLVHVQFRQKRGDAALRLRVIG